MGRGWEARAAADLLPVVRGDAGKIQEYRRLLGASGTYRRPAGARTYNQERLALALGLGAGVEGASEAYIAAAAPEIEAAAKTPGRAAAPFGGREPFANTYEGWSAQAHVLAVAKGTPAAAAVANRYLSIWATLAHLRRGDGPDPVLHKGPGGWWWRGWCVSSVGVRSGPAWVNQLLVAPLAQWLLTGEAPGLLWDAWTYQVARELGVRSALIPLEGLPIWVDAGGGEFHFARCSEGSASWLSDRPRGSMPAVMAWTWRKMGDAGTVRSIYPWDRFDTHIKGKGSAYPPARAWEAGGLIHVERGESGEYQTVVEVPGTIREHWTLSGVGLARVGPVAVPPPSPTPTLPGTVPGERARRLEIAARLRTLADEIEVL